MIKLDSKPGQLDDKFYIPAGNGPREYNCTDLRKDTEKKGDRACPRVPASQDPQLLRITRMGSLGCSDSVAGLPRSISGAPDSSA